MKKFFTLFGSHDKLVLMATAIFSLRLIYQVGERLGQLLISMIC